MDRTRGFPGRAFWLAILWVVAGAVRAAAQEGLDDYPLDAAPRAIAPQGEVTCPHMDLVRYRGELFGYQGGILVNAAFRERLRLFEEAVREVALEVYGRAPLRVVHAGGFKCRRIRRYPDLLSEHGLGNAIDVKGFDFGPAPPGAELPKGLPRSLEREFRVRLQEHWDARGATGKRHAAFLRTLARKLIARPDIFRVLLGPAWPGHGDHFHFDCASYRLVSVFE